MKKILVITLVLTSFFHINLYAKIVKAKYAGEFMASGVDARPLGMGGAFVAIADGVSAGYWNPAGLGNIKNPQIIGMYAERFAKLVNFNYGGIALPTKRNTALAFSFTRVGVDDIHYTALPNADLEVGAEYEKDGSIVRNIPYISDTFNDAEWAFYLSFAKRKSHRFSWGGNVKVVTKQVGENSAWGLGFDVGMLYKTYSDLLIGFNFQDVTTTLLAWDTGRQEAISPTLKAGMAYPLEIPVIFGTLLPAMDLDFRFENRQTATQIALGRLSVDTHFGLEYKFKEILALRVGSADVGDFTAGVGIKLPNLNVDYAFLKYDELGNTHRISVKLTIEDLTKKKK